MAPRADPIGGGYTPVLVVTRVLAAIIVPFLVAAWWILYVVPERTGELFAWPVAPTMTAMFLGSVYLGGAYFFVRVIMARSWERVAVGFLPVTGFATLMGVATVLHWDRFTSGHISFVTWAALYFTTPFLVLGVWLLNERQRAPRSAVEPSAVVLSPRAQRVAGVLGAGAVVIALVLFAWPEGVIGLWPWTLTPLTTRVLAAMLLLGGAGLGVARDPRWTSVRLMVQVAWVMLGLILVGVIRAWGEFDPGNLMTWFFAAWLVVTLASTAIAYRGMERRRAPSLAES